MKNLLRLLAIHSALVASFAIPLSASSAQQADADPVEMVQDTDPVMNAAIAEAQATLPEWLAVLDEPPRGYEGIVFKFPLNGIEHIWVDDVVREGDELIGHLSNNPRIEGYRLGDKVRVPLRDVSDWAYRDATGRAHGYRTVTVLFDRLSAEEVASIKQNFGWTE